MVDSAARLTPGDAVLIGGTIARVTGVAGEHVSLDTPVTAAAGAPVLVGATWSLTWQNTGSAEAQDVVIDDPLPAGWIFVAASPSATSAPGVGANGGVSWSVGTASPGASGTLQLTAIPTASGAATNTATLSAAGGVSEQASATVLVGGLTVAKSTSTPVVPIYPDGGVALYTISLRNSLASPVSDVSVTDLLPSGFSYQAGSASVGEPGFAPDDTDKTQPTWSGLTVPAGGMLTIQFAAEVAASTGTATYQNEVVATAPHGEGVTPFDALATTDEDVTVVGDGYHVLEGHVFRDLGTRGTLEDGDPRLGGVRVEVNDSSGLDPFVIHTDSAGYFRLIVPAGTWTVSIPSGEPNATTLDGLRLWDSYTLPAQVVFGTQSPVSRTVLAGYVASGTPASEAALTVVKSAYEGHPAGAGCPDASDPLVIVDATQAPKAITWCFKVTNTGNTHLANPVFDDAPLGITPGTNQGLVQLRAGSTLPLAPGATAWWYVEESRTTSLENTVEVEMTPMDGNGQPLGLPAVRSAGAGAVFAYVFDPPFGIKTGQLNGQNVVRWTMVWINDSVITAEGVVITDPIPAGMTYLGNLACTPRGSTVVHSCVFEDAVTAPPRGRLRVVADIGADPGATGEADAANELLIAFDVTVQPSSSQQTLENQGLSEWDVFGDGSLMLEAETYDPLTSDPGNPGPTGITVPAVTAPRPIPSLSGVDAALLVLLIMATAGARWRAKAEAR